MRFVRGLASGAEVCDWREAPLRSAPPSGTAASFLLAPNPTGITFSLLSAFQRGRAGSAAGKRVAAVKCGHWWC